MSAKRYYSILIIPASVVAPLFIHGDIEFDVAQSAMAFAQLVGTFSLIVSQFQSISSFTAAVSRLGSLWEGFEEARTAEVSAIAGVKEHECVAYEHAYKTVYRKQADFCQEILTIRQ